MSFNGSDMQQHSVLAANQLTRPSTCIVIALLLMGLAAIEHDNSPWRPFYVLYAGLCILIPLLVGGVPLSRPRLSGLNWSALVIAVFVVQFSLQWLASTLWPWALLQAGVPAEEVHAAYWSIGRALPAAIAQHAAHWGVEAGRLVASYFLFITLWAGVGEEFFYRGYLHEHLRRPLGVTVATLISSAFFALRHAVQLQGPEYPFGAAALWISLSFMLGILFALLYERKRSIWPAVAAHSLFNLIPAAALAASKG